MNFIASKDTAIMICGHGSRDPGAVSEFNRLAVHIRARFPETDVESGFLEFARPMIHDGLEKLVERGARRILAVPGMLFAAGHVKNDLPSELNEFAAARNGVSVQFGRELGIDTKLLKASRARILEAVSAADADRAIAPEDTLLLVVGRGTNDPDANSNVAKVTRMLWEGMGFGWADTAYSGVAFPLVDKALATLAPLGFKRIVVFPYFLFTGVLVRRIYDWADQAAEAFPDIQFVKAPYLNDHPFVIDSFAERIVEITRGETAMNCQLCKYREQVIGYENSVGEAQAGHHHHVRGAGVEDPDHHHHHHHGHGHHHHHGDGDGHEHGHAHDGPAHMFPAGDRPRSPDRGPDIGSDTGQNPADRPGLAGEAVGSGPSRP